MTRLLLIALLFSCKILFSCEAAHEKPKIEEKKLSFETAQKIKLRFSSRVDTTKRDVKAVLNLYENYINSEPDIIYDNPYWNSREKKQYKDFDFSRVSIYNGINSRQLFSIYTPFVLSIETKEGMYQIRVLYSNAATEEPYVGSKVWCIHKLNAIKEKGVWKLENLLVDKTKNWKKRQFDFIEYVFSEEHSLNTERANQALTFCKGIINRFNPEFNNPFKFYITNRVDEMGELENFDYYFTGVTTGKAREGMILSSKGDEFYPHEFIHKLLPINEHRGEVMEEGLATFLGTKEDLDEYLSLMQKLAKDFNRKASYTLENILNNQTEWNGYQVAYPGGALICEVIYEKKGDDGINLLARGQAMNYGEIISLAKNILQVEEADVLQLIEEKIKEYQ